MAGKSAEQAFARQAAKGWIEPNADVQTGKKRCTKAVGRSGKNGLWLLKLLFYAKKGWADMYFIVR
ncbi:MAG: hypothetical protein NXH83_01790 [Rhodobacteraceae bacterium]|nr:hypothetical protein [Paracoccaceae bacterium]